MRRVFLISVVSVALFFFCSIVAKAQYITKEEAPTADEAEQQLAEAGNKICPVSGEKINEEARVAYEYEGKIYNFCCASCIDEFKKDPQKYIQKVEEELQAEPEAKTYRDSDIEKVSAYQESRAESKEQAEHKEHEMDMMQESGTSHQGHHH